MNNSKKHVYEGKDLEAMAFAANYSRWILEIFKPYMGKNIVEVGAGKGSFSRLIAELSPKKLVLIEPSEDMYGELSYEIKKMPKGIQTVSFNGFLSDSAQSIKTSHRPDSVMYVNVLEHVEEDDKELQLVSTILPKKGRIFIFVPALQSLYSKYDKSIGHYRRYTKKELEQKCEKVGLKVIYSQYFDMPGIIPWWIRYTKGGSTHMSSKSIGKYDRYAIPLIKSLESKLKPPIGKNIILVAEK